MKLSSVSIPDSPKSIQPAFIKMDKADYTKRFIWRDVADDLRIRAQFFRLAVQYQKPFKLFIPPC